MPWRSSFASKFVTLLVVTAVFVVLEIQIQQLQTQVRLLSEAQAQRNDYIGGAMDKGLIRDKNAVNSAFENDIGEDWDSSEDNQMVHSNGKTIVFYNRVPKTGSTSFTGVVYALCSKNNFHVIHLNVSKNLHVMGLPDQMRFARNVTTWTSKMPSFYHGHQAYLDFGRLGFEKRPIYINIVRKPLERLVSYYYFLRFGDDFRPGLRRARQGNLETFDECVVNRHKDCQLDRLWLQIPFFCGQHPECWEPGNQWALQKAKDNLVNNYLVVGVTERLTEFVEVMEAVLPRYFKGATKKFLAGGKSHLRKTHAKKQLKLETLDYFKRSKIWQMENEFYLFANSTFADTLKKTDFMYSKGKFVVGKKKFFFEKIRPKPRDSL